MIYVFCQVHGMNGKPIGGKIYAIPKLKGMTLKLRKNIYANIVNINGKLKKLGRYSMKIRYEVRKVTPEYRKARKKRNKAAAKSRKRNR